MKSWFWLYQNEHFQEMFILIQPPTPLYQMEHFQDLLFLLQIKSFNFLLLRQVSFPVNHGGLQADYYGGSGGRSPPVKQKFKLDFSCPNSARYEPELSSRV